MIPIGPHLFDVECVTLGKFIGYGFECCHRLSHEERLAVLHGKHDVVVYLVGAVVPFLHVHQSYGIPAASRRE